MKFTKMQGAGNDYLYIDCTHRMINNPAELSVLMSDRHFGAGADGIVLICPSSSGDFRMRIFNADGSEAEMCGNASRCIGKYVYEKGLTDKTQLTLETGSGLKYLTLHVEHGMVNAVTVDMGEPELTVGKIPVQLETSEKRIIDYPLDVNGIIVPITAVSMGNPHAVLFVSDVKSMDIETLGKQIEHHVAFPKRTNVEFIEVVTPERLKMRVWERGSGETWACGTGACASVVAGVLNGRCGRKTTVELRGGELFIEWNEIDNRVYMTGGAAFVYEGEWPE